MIDFLKIVVNDLDLISLIWNNDLLEYDSEESKRTSYDEIRNVVSKKFKNLKFTRYYNRLEISGSLHSLFNNGIHNANDFLVSSCILTIKQIEQNLKLALDKCLIVNIEFGVQVIPISPIKELIPSIEFHGRNAFRYLTGIKYAKQSASFYKDTKVNSYKIIKSYAKGLQDFNSKYYCDENAFRFEVKSKKSRYINSLGIKTLADLLKIEVYRTLSRELIKEWNEVLIIEPKIKFEQREEKYNNPKFWERILNGYRNSFSYHRKCYFKLLEKYAGNIHSEILGLISRKLDDLIGISAISPPFHNCNLVHIHQSIRGEYASIDDMRTCPVTGINISMQKESSHFLSISGLKRLRHNDLPKFEEIRRHFLPRSGVSGKHTKYELDEFYHIAKQIRSTFSNLHRNKNIAPIGQLSFLHY